MKNKGNEKGVALIMTMIILGVLSAMAVGFMFLSQSETWSTLNYRLTSQARDAAEAGLNSATNFLINSYTVPATSASCTADALGCYTLTSFPVKVQSNSDTVGLYASGSSVPSGVSYPSVASSVQSAFNADGVGFGTITNAIGGITSAAQFKTYATLLSMRQFTVYGGGSATVQTWQIVSDGIVNTGVRNSQVEVSVTLERPIVPTFNYAAFATSSDCNAQVWANGGTVDSYDSAVSTTFPVPNSQISNSGGNLGTNGNLNVGNGNVNIYGNLSTPAIGTGTCTSGGGVTAETLCNGCTATGIVALPQTVTYTTPALPSPMPALTTLHLDHASDCPTGAGAIPGCTFVDNPGTSNDYFDLLPCPTSGSCTAGGPGSYGNLDVASGAVIHLSAGTYNLNSINAVSNATIVTSGQVVVNVAGCNTLNGAGTDCATYLNLANNTITCSGSAYGCSGGYLPVLGSRDPVGFSSGSLSGTTNSQNFQVLYAGLGEVNIQTGGAAGGAVVYAPNAYINMTGNGTWYGALIGNRVNVGSGSTIHYDRNLQNGLYTVGNHMLGGFNWAKF